MELEKSEKSINDVIKELNIISQDTALQQLDDATIISRIATVLGCSSNSTFLALIACLQHYLRLYTEAPQQIRDATHEAVEGARYRVIQMLEMQRTIEENLNKTIKRTSFWHICLTILITIILTIILGVSMRFVIDNNAYNRGYAAGLSSAQDKIIKILEERNQEKIQIEKENQKADSLNQKENPKDNQSRKNQKKK